MTPDVIVERRADKVPAFSVRPANTASTARTEPPPRAESTAALMFIVVAMVVALTAFFAGLKELSAAEYSPEELEAAQGMEALMANMLIGQMRKSVQESDFMPKSSAEKIFESMLDYEYAQTMSRAGTFGLSELILAEMRRNR